jgi:heptosyltransferase-2
MKTLVRATNWVGDVLLSLPALKALRASFPRDRITVLARPWVAELYRLREEVDDVLVEELQGERAAHARLVAELKRHRFDQAILLPSSFRTAWTAFAAGIPERIGWRGELRAPLLTRSLSPWVRPAGEHEVWKHLRIAHAAGAEVPEHPDTSWPAGRAEKEAARRLLREAGIGEAPFLAAHVASFAHAAKRWDHARFAELFSRLTKDRDLCVVLLGSEAERAQNGAIAASVGERAVDLSGRTSLPEALGVLSLARAFVGNDSGLAHLAAAAGTPTVVVFGPTDPDATRPWDGLRGDGLPPRVTVVRSPVLCAPCRFRVCPIDHRCMTGVTVDAVHSAVVAGVILGGVRS